MKRSNELITRTANPLLFVLLICVTFFGVDLTSVSFICEAATQDTIPLYCNLLQTVADMSHVTREPVFGVSDQVQYKPGCTATEDG